MRRTMTNKPVLMAIQRNEETNQLKIGLIELAVPIWGWQYLLGRADALYGGDLNIAVNEVFSAGLMAYVELGEINMEPANKLPC